MVSIIIVHYHVLEEMLQCIESIGYTKTRSTHEIIVVDNDEEKTIYAKLHSIYPNVRYIPNTNKGFGQANNFGAQHAKGEFLFFLNPDTKLLNNCLDILVDYLKTNSTTGLIAPLLHFDDKKTPQGLGILSPITALVALSFINKLFPNNAISTNYWNTTWDRKSIITVGSVPGTAFLIKKLLFEKVGGFDEKFFLYFEEIDLCQRVRSLGFTVVMLPTASVYHKWGASTQKSSINIQKVFAQSRFYYFKKHFGLLWAIVVECVTQIKKEQILFSVILLAGLIVRIYRLPELMPFIGDQGWFYLSARDMVVAHQIPLVGIASSHPWLHQGALFTYLLSIALFFGHFNPVSGGVLTVFIDIVALYALYKLGSLLFSKRLGVIAGALYAFSPLVILNARMPYHTAPIPLCTILFVYCLYQWTKKNVNYFPLVILCLGVLYNFELATFVFVYVVFIIFLYGFLQKKDFVTKLLNGKIVLFSVCAFIISLFPVLLYDLSHNFLQTIGFLAWNGYKVATFFGFSRSLSSETSSLSTLFSFSFEKYKMLLVLSSLSAYLLLLTSIWYFLFNFIKRREQRHSLSVLSIILAVSTIGFFASRTPSDAYLPMLFPVYILLTAYLFDNLMKARASKRFASIALVLLIVVNCYSLISSNYYYYDNVKKFSYTKRFEIAKTIVRKAKGREYDIKGEGNGSKFASFTMNYEYLTWYAGHGSSHKHEKLQFIIKEDTNGITVRKYD